MIDLYFWTTPNGMKPLIMLNELDLEFTLKPVNISRGAQFDPAFSEISPNQKIPAIVDHKPAGSVLPLTLFESGAILQYLAEKAVWGIPITATGRAEVMQWLFWQMAGLGPTLGQYMHFHLYADQDVPYAQGRFEAERARLYSVLNEQIGCDYVAGEYSIADIAIYPWIRRLEREGSYLTDHPNLEDWYNRLSERPAVVQAYEMSDEVNVVPTVTRESKRFLLAS